jgi:hypothetical protein
MNTETLQAYRRSGKYPLPGLLLPVVAAVVVGVPLGLVYAYLIKWIPFAIVNVLITGSYGFVFGWVTKQMVKAGRVRHAGLAALCGLGAGLIGLYFEWSGHLHTLTKDAPWVFAPDEIWRGMQVLFKEGSWSLRGNNNNVTGFRLVLFWLIEAGIIVVLAVLMPSAFVASTPFCEQSRCWLDEERKIDTLAAFSDLTQLDALRAGDLMPLTLAPPKAADATEFTRLLLKRSPKCRVFFTLCVENVKTEIDDEGDRKEKTRDLTADLVLPASMFDLIAQLADLKPIPAASAPGEGADAHPGERK